MRKDIGLCKSVHYLHRIVNELSIAGCSEKDPFRFSEPYDVRYNAPDAFDVAYAGYDIAGPAVDQQTFILQSCLRFLLSLEIRQYHVHEIR